MAGVAAPVQPSQLPNTKADPAVAIEANAGTSLESAVADGKIALTDKPKLGEPEAFFPANPAAHEQLAQNKPVKELKSSDRTSSGSLLRSISDVITDLRKKHQDRKRTRGQEANSGSPSQAKVRKSVETAAESPSAAPSAEKPHSRLASSKSGSGGSGKVQRMTCWGTSDQAGPAAVKKPSLAERYSAWKAAQRERKDAGVSKTAGAGKAAGAANGPAAPKPDDAQPVVVSEKTTAAEASQVAKLDTPANAGIIIEPLAE